MRIPTKKILDNTIFDKFLGVSEMFDTKYYQFYSKTYDLGLIIAKYDTEYHVFAGDGVEYAKSNKELLDIVKQY